MNTLDISLFILAICSMWLAIWSKRQQLKTQKERDDLKKDCIYLNKRIIEKDSLIQEKMRLINGLNRKIGRATVHITSAQWSLAWILVYLFGILLGMAL